MLTKGIRKYLANPAIGILASILYILLYTVTGKMGLTLLVSIIFTAVLDVFLRIYTRTRVCSLMLMITLVSLLITSVFWWFFRFTSIPDVIYLIIFEITMVVLLNTTRLAKTYVSIYLSRKDSVVQKAFLVELFEVARLIQYAFTMHLFGLLIYRLMRISYGFNETVNLILYDLVPLFLLLVIFGYEMFKTQAVVKHLRKEEWLPIVTESGEVTGKIAKSVSMKMKNKFMHPVVRVALIYNGELYLQKRSSDDILNPSSYDYPFEKYMLFNSEINIAVRNSIARSLNLKDLPFSFLLKYVFENEDTKRLVFLFVARIETEEQLQSVSLLNGKFWTEKQIDEGFEDDGLFSECFQMEYEYLKNTVLRSDQLRREVVNNK